MEKNGYFNSNILYGEKPLLPEQNFPLEKKMAISKTKFLMEKNDNFNKKISHDQKKFLKGKFFHEKMAISKARRKMGCFKGKIFQEEKCFTAYCFDHYLQSICSENGPTATKVGLVALVVTSRDLSPILFIFVQFFWCLA